MGYFKKFIIVFFIFCIPPFLHAQDAGSCDKVYEKEEVEIIAQFKSGENDLLFYVSNSLRYPKDALDKKIQGLVVTEFTIDTEGKIRNLKIKKSVHSSLDSEAIRVVKSMPKWKPAQKNGDPVCMRYVLPVRFALSQLF